LRGRPWGLIVNEARENIRTPTPSSKICRLIKINHPQLKRLVKEGVLMFVGKKPNNNGPDYKLYKATKEESN